MTVFVEEDDHNFDSLLKGSSHTEFKVSRTINIIIMMSRVSRAIFDSIFNSGHECKDCAHACTSEMTKFALLPAWQL